MSLKGSMHDSCFKIKWLGFYRIFIAAQAHVMYNSAALEEVFMYNREKERNRRKRFNDFLHCEVMLDFSEYSWSKKISKIFNMLSYQKDTVNLDMGNDSDHHYPLWIAIHTGRTEIVKNVFAIGADPNVETAEKQYSSLKYAIMLNPANGEERDAIIDMLVERGVDVEQRTYEFFKAKGQNILCTPLMTMIMRDEEALATGFFNKTHQKMTDACLLEASGLAREKNMNALADLIASGAMENRRRKSVQVALTGIANGNSKPITHRKLAIRPQTKSFS